MNSLTAIIATIHNAWNTYFQEMVTYQSLADLGTSTVENQWNLYTQWCICSELWKGYTSTLKQLNDLSNWSQAVPVTYGEPVAICYGDSPVVYINAYTGHDEETALCRNAGGQLMMRVGGYPDGTHIFCSTGMYQIVAGAPVQINLN